MQKEIKLGLVVGFALLLAILLVWYKSGEEETAKPGTTESGAIEDLLAGKTTPAPTPPAAKEKELEAFPLPPQTAPGTTELQKPATEVQPTPAAEIIEIPKTTPVKGEIGPPGPKPATPIVPPKPPVEVAKATTPKTEGPTAKEEETEKKKEEPTEKEVAPAATEQIYVVQAGDNLTKIARKFYQDDSKWTLIQEANKSVIKTPETLYVGLKLKIPPAPGAKATAEAKKPETAPKEEAAKPRERAGAEEGERKYTVQKGDNLTSIAEDQYGDGKLWKKILEANKNLKDPRDLKEGQVIIIPPK